MTNLFQWNCHFIMIFSFLESIFKNLVRTNSYSCCARVKYSKSVPHFPNNRSWRNWQTAFLYFKFNEIRLIVKEIKQGAGVKSSTNINPGRDCQFNKWFVNYKVFYHQVYPPCLLLWDAVRKQLSLSVCPLCVILWGRGNFFSIIKTPK